MTSRMPVVSDSDLTHMMLKYSLDAGWFKKSDMYFLIKSTRRIANTLNDLTDKGMFKTRQTTKGHIVVYYHITDRGILCYRVQCLMNAIIKGDVDLDDPDVAEAIETVVLRVCPESVRNNPLD